MRNVRMQIQYGGTHEHIKRVDRVGRVLLSCCLFNFMGDVMKEHRELQTLIDELERHIIQQDNLIEKLERDALRYRWLNKYTAQLFMVTEEQMNAEVDRAMAGGMK